MLNGNITLAQLFLMYTLAESKFKKKKKITLTQKFHFKEAIL